MDVEAALSNPGIAQRPASVPDARGGERASRIVASYVADHELLQEACVLNPDGSTRAAAQRPGTVAGGLDELHRPLRELCASYPGKRLLRLVAEDDGGTIIVAFLEDRSTLIVAADPQARLGSVSRIVARMVRSLTAG